ncbi:MAG: hypothetical protein E7378_00450 [Clostridiales bacterium]|nr:hypothetical protein [Clostridiales bacterium]
MKKKFKFIALLMIACCMFMFAGCDLFARNNADYFNQIVITATYNDGTKIEIDRKDFITAYNNYGQNLISSYGYTEDRAKEETVNALVNREVLLKEAERVALTPAGAAIKLTDAEKQELYYQTYSSLISNIKSFESEIRDDWDMPLEEVMAEETKSGTVYNKYTKQARPQYDALAGEFRIKLLENNDTAPREVTFANQDQIYNKFIAESKNNNVDAFAKEGYRRYLSNLQESQEILGTNYGEGKLVKGEIDRIYKNLYESKIIEKYQEYLGENNDYSYITVDQVLNKYKAMVYSSNFVYANDATKFNDDMLGNRKNVNYFVNDNYFYVAHILVKFSDKQQKEYNELETKSNNGQGYIISAQDYKEQKAALYNGIMASVRDAETGEIKNEDTIKVQDVLAEIQNELAAAHDNAAKAEAFRNLMYKYNEDDGIMNAEYPYVIGVNDSKMVENFTNASRELHQAGEYGAISGLVESEYGLHIIFYMGACENAFELDDNNKLNLRANYQIEDNGVTFNYSDVLKLDETYLNDLHNKTIFDAIYETLNNDGYSKYENMNIDALKSQYGIDVNHVENLI